MNGAGPIVYREIDKVNKIGKLLRVRHQQQHKLPFSHRIDENHIHMSRTIAIQL